MDSLEDLSTLVEELDEHTEVESMWVGEESDDQDEEYIYEEAEGLQESYNSLLEKTREYARVAKATISYVPNFFSYVALFWNSSSKWNSSLPNLSSEEYKIRDDRSI